MKKISFDDPMDVCKYVTSFIEKHNITNEDLAQDLYLYAIQVFDENGPYMSRNFYQDFASKYRALVNEYEKIENNRPERLVDNTGIQAVDFVEGICDQDFYNLIRAEMQRALSPKEMDLLKMYFDDESNLQVIANHYHVSRTYAGFSIQQVMRKMREKSNGYGIHRLWDSIKDDVAIPDTPMLDITRLLS